MKPIIKTEELTKNDEIISALDGNDTVQAKGGDDLVYGGLGNDQLDGGPGSDQIVGGSGNDVLIGSKGSDILSGDAGKDILIGVSTKAKNPGRKEIDVFEGGSGADTFVLGDESKVFYVDKSSSSSGESDYASILDFSLGQGDMIQLSGSASEYSLSALSNGTGIYSTTVGQPELIGIVAFTNIINLDEDIFVFV